MTRPRARALLAGAVLALAVAAGAWTGWEPLLRPALTVPLLLVLPGSALLAALPRPSDRDAVATGVAAVGASIVVVMAVALVLHTTSLPEGPLPLAVGTSLVTAVALLAAARRRHEHRAAAGPVAAVTLTRPVVADLVLGALAVVVAAGAVTVARSSAQATPEPAFTELSIRRTAPPDDVGVAVDIRNAEGRPVTYSVVVMVDGRPVREWPSLPTATDAERTLLLPLAPQDRRLRVTAELSVLGGGRLYRTVTLAAGG